MKLTFDMHLHGNDEGPRFYTSTFLIQAVPQPEKGHRTEDGVDWEEYVCRTVVALPNRRGLREACTLLLADVNQMEYGRSLLMDVFDLPWNTPKKGKADYHCAVTRRVKAYNGWVYTIGRRPTLMRNAPLWQGPLILGDETDKLLDLLCMHAGLRQDVFALFSVIMARSYAAFAKHGRRL